MTRRDAYDELLRRIFAAVPGGVVHVARDGTLLDANDEARRWLGVQPDEDLVGRSIREWASSTIREDRTPFPASEYPVARVLATGEPYGPVTIGVTMPDRELSWGLFRAVPVPGADGALAGAIVTFLDITERKRTEEALAASEQKWRVLGENLPDFVVLVDREARMLSINRILPGYGEEQVIGRSALDFVDPSSAAEWRRAFDAALETGVTQRVELRGEAGPGSVAWYESTFVPLLEDGVVERMLLVSRDVTERRAMIASLAEKERLASVGMIAASVAHEVMNPLTSVLASLELAVSKRCTDDARRTKAVEEAREGARRMQQIVWDLRSLGRAGNEELFYVDARAVFETALRLSGTDLTRSVRVVLELADVPGVLASESRLCQVFINLLSNAVQAMEGKPSGAREIRVRTRHDEGAGLVGIEVSDSGEGIPPDRLGRIFEPFYSTKRAGTGLGLSISRDIVGRMGGHIDVTSTPGAGATFTVWLSTTRPPPARAAASAQRD